MATVRSRHGVAIGWLAVMAQLMLLLILMHRLGSAGPDTAPEIPVSLAWKLDDRRFVTLQSATPVSLGSLLRAHCLLEENRNSIWRLNPNFPRKPGAGPEQTILPASTPVRVFLGNSACELQFPMGASAVP